MNLEEILSISGKPGLYKLVAQSRGGVIVETLDGSKRFPVSSSNNISSLKDIAIYTHDEEVALADVFKKIADKEDYGTTISHKEDPAKLRSYMMEILSDYDEGRVYHSDLKKLFSWYNLLHEYGMIVPEEEEETKGEEEEKEASSSEEE